MLLMAILLGELAHAGELRRVRPVTRELAWLMEAGYEQSPTFRAIVDQLAGKSVIVHVEPSNSLPSGVDGVLRFAAATPRFRYLRVSLRVGLHPKIMVAILAHELQHALEIDQASWVVDVDTLRELYQVIGVPTCKLSGRECYDTEPARLVGRLDRDEIGVPTNEAGPGGPGRPPPAH